MTIDQREQNPDVNSYNPDAGITENPTPSDRTGDAPTSDIERKPGRDVIPVPPDVEPTAPIEEPPSNDGPPVGDVDDSPKRIA